VQHLFVFFSRAQEVETIKLAKANAKPLPKSCSAFISYLKLCAEKVYQAIKSIVAKNPKIKWSKEKSFWSRHSCPSACLLGIMKLQPISAKSENNEWGKNKIVKSKSPNTHLHRNFSCVETNNIIINTFSSCCCNRFICSFSLTEKCWKKPQVKVK